MNGIYPKNDQWALVWVAIIAVLLSVATSYSVLVDRIAHLEARVEILLQKDIR